MNKQEAIEKIKNIETLNIKDRMDDKGVYMVIKNQVLDIISQIDEPQKPVVPKFVLDWVGYCKFNRLTLLGAFDPVSELGVGLVTSLTEELRKGKDWAQRNQETFARAWLDGYEIEQEKLYTVEIEGVSSGKLFKNIRTNEYLFHSGNGFNGYTDKLTETEIKQKDERLWQFAKEVEE